jgi:methylenetetrahydrofolate reductase (NADPH)
MAADRSAAAAVGAPTVGELLARGACYSFEFFPPKTDEGERALWQSLRQLEPLAPAFVSVTYGAGGSERDRTVRVTERIATETTMNPVGHLTCVGSSVAELRQVVGQYAAAGVRNILALRGDPPTGLGTEWTPHADGLQHAARDLDLGKLARTTQVVRLAEVPAVVGRMFEGKVRGRTVVDVNA